MQKLLQWIYYGDTELPDEDIFLLVKIYLKAQDYQMADLQNRCEEQILMQLSSANVL